MRTPSLGWCLILCILAGCGQKGPLSLPQPTVPQAPPPPSSTPTPAGPTP